MKTLVHEPREKTASAATTVRCLDCILPHNTSHWIKAPINNKEIRDKDEAIQSVMNIFNVLKSVFRNAKMSDTNLPA